MTKRTKTLLPAEDRNDFLELSGDITDYWSYSQVRDYVLLMKGLSHTALRLYLVLRSMMRETSSWPRGGMRRMTIDQLCWVLPGTGPDDKPISVSAMYVLLDGLEKAGLVHQKDAREVEGASKLKGKEKAARGIARGLEVRDLPPAQYEGWRNAWDKLDAYHPNWRESPPKPPTHITEMTQGEDGRISARVRPVGPGGKPFQKTGTAEAEGPDTPAFQKTGTPTQKTGTASQNPGTIRPLTSENDHPLRSSLEEALSTQGAPAVPGVPPPSAQVRAERETDAAPDNNSEAASAQDASVPGAPSCSRMSSWW